MPYFDKLLFNGTFDNLGFFAENIVPARWFLAVFVCLCAPPAIMFIMRHFQFRVWLKMISSREVLFFMLCGMLLED